MKLRAVAAFALVTSVVIGACVLANKEKAAEERAQWHALAVRYVACLTGGTVSGCRAEIEREEWIPVTPATGTRTELQGTIAPGGATFPSPGVAPEGDFCISHDDIDYNFNVTPDPAFAALLQPANLTGDADHPAGGVIEGEWESFYLDPAYVAKPAGAGANYHDWGAPDVDMKVGDHVAARGAGVLDRGHRPFRSEMHPPYLLLWGGARNDALVVYARASARLARPSDFQPLPDPPLAEEALRSRFRMPALFTCPGGVLPTIAVTQSTEFFLDAPSIVSDQGCDLANGVNLTDFEGPAFETALASPAAHLAGTSTPAGAAAFFAVAVTTTHGAIDVTLTPISRPRDAFFGAKITAAWSCP